MLKLEECTPENKKRVYRIVNHAKKLIEESGLRRIEKEERKMYLDEYLSNYEKEYNETILR